MADTSERRRQEIRERQEKQRERGGVVVWMLEIDDLLAMIEERDRTIAWWKEEAKERSETIAALQADLDCHKRVIETKSLMLLRAHQEAGR